ncbi:MAG: DNA polymerase III subunit delta [Candidatus Yanofskybacteria bacterium]|nr:DNA polymerase III subunit delta [Candidatus Yanofskybacteria bacterium]
MDRNNHKLNYVIIFLYGRDGYRLKQNLEKIIDEYKKKYSGLGYSVLDFDETGQMALLEDIVKTVSFFDEKRLIVLKKSFNESDTIGKLIETWSLIGDKQRILIFVEEIDGAELARKNKSFFAILTAEPNVVKSFEFLEGKKLETWITKELRLASIEIEPAAIKKLISYADNDCWRLGQEIAKLTNYRIGFDDKKITVADVDLLVYSKENLNIFKIVDAVAGKNKLKAMVLLHNHIENGDDPHYIFSMIVYQFRNLLRVKSLMKNAVPFPMIIKKTGLNPFVVKKTYEQCHGYDLDELRRLFASLAQMDIEVKSGVSDIENSLFRFVFSATV